MEVKFCQRGNGFSGHFLANAFNNGMTILYPGRSLTGAQ
jgi:hypothetical protein